MILTQRNNIPERGDNERLRVISACACMMTEEATPKAHIITTIKHTIITIIKP